MDATRFDNQFETRAAGREGQLATQSCPSQGADSGQKQSNASNLS